MATISTKKTTKQQRADLLTVYLKLDTDYSVHCSFSHLKFIYFGPNQLMSFVDLCLFPVV